MCENRTWNVHENTQCVQAHQSFNFLRSVYKGHRTMCLKIIGKVSFYCTFLAF